MKRLFCLFLTLTLLLCACTPDGRTDPTEDTGVETVLPTQTSPTTEPTEETLPQTDALDDLRNNLPIMDGSTSLIPLEAGIRAALYGKTIEEATLDVVHSTTWDSFWNLLSGNVDLVFSVPLSQEQWDYAANQGVTLETVPIAKEGFVFVVNAENPVDTLTQEQLRDIYSGKITNWSEVGGLDEAIIPYQRNNDSGSQNYMITFMGDTPLMDAPTEMRPTSMSGLMDVVALNDNARGAIGYSVYAYAADMYGNGNDIKFIQVDGIAPSKATMASGDYPLLGENIAVFNANAPEDGYVRQLVDWICSYDGQLALAQAGYVTLEDIGFDYTEMTLSKYQGVGTGPVPEATFAYQYGVSTLRTRPDGTPYWNEDYWSNSVALDSDMMTYEIVGLADETLQAEIQDFIDSQIRNWAWALSLEVKARLEEQSANQEYGGYSTWAYSWELRQLREDLPLHVGISITNGYLSAAVSVAHQGAMESSVFRRTETATWDLLTGKQLTPEELFFQGTDIDQVLNDEIQQQIQFIYDYAATWSNSSTPVQDFGGLTTEGWHLTHDGIFFDQNNPYFDSGIFISLKDMPLGSMVSQESRDFSHTLTGDKVICTKSIREIAVRQYYDYCADGFATCGFLDESFYPQAETINKTIRAYIDEYFREDRILAYYADLDVNTDELNLYWMDFRPTNLGNRYILYRGPSIYGWTDNNEDSIDYPYTAFPIFDLETGKMIDWEDLLLPGWEEHSTLSTYSSSDRLELNLDGMIYRHLATIPGESYILISFIQGTDVYNLTVPLEYLDL